MAVWFDVEDLIRYFRYAARPTGIQRLSFEIYRALARMNGDVAVRFCRRGAGPWGFRSVDFAALEAGIRAAASAGGGLPAVAARPRPPSALAERAKRLPQHYRLPLGEMARGLAQLRSGAVALGRSFRTELTGKVVRDGQIGGHQFNRDDQPAVFAAGDWFVSLGASWDVPYETALLERLHAGGVRLAVMVHDLIPELYPEWTSRSNVAPFRAWLRGTVVQADTVFVISRNTGADLQRSLAGFGHVAPKLVTLQAGLMEKPVAAPLPAAIVQPYVLMVSTIEIRKNHQLMFRVWRRLLDQFGGAGVPDLVFAGKEGWLTGDFRQQLENSGWLGGKIKFLASPSEPELAALYTHCLFTVFPSFYEGWGLPVTESLSFGKTVAAANTSAIAEAGSDFCSYFNPDDLDEAYRVIAGMIAAPSLVAAAEARIAAEFRPPRWDDAAAAIMAALAPAA